MRGLGAEVLLRLRSNVEHLLYGPNPLSVYRGGMPTKHWKTWFFLTVSWEMIKFSSVTKSPHRAID